jgi:hypothetical protein
MSLLLGPLSLYGVIWAVLTVTGQLQNVKVIMPPFFPSYAVNRVHCVGANYYIYKIVCGVYINKLYYYLLRWLCFINLNSSLAAVKIF